METTNQIVYDITEVLYAVYPYHLTFFYTTQNYKKIF